MCVKSVYEKHGYADRFEYLDHLAEQYGVSIELVYGLADLLGPSEDFDGLINALEEID